tara:strand:+ start:78 stop:497 length:420 start_codon:yes stop_codon:yes gene_type:complete
MDHVRIEAVEALVLCCQILVFQHLLQEVAVLVEGVLRVTIHLVFFLKALFGLEGEEKLIDLFEGVPSNLPFGVEHLVGKALVNGHLFEVLICSVLVGIVVRDTYGWSSFICVWILVIDVPQLVTVSFMELVDWDVIKIG